MNNKIPPQTSIDAFRSLKEGEVKQTYSDIIWALSVIKKGTFEDIAKFLKCKPDRIWKRLGELAGKKYDLIERPGERKPLKSGRSGYVWVLKSGTPIIERPIPGKSIADFSRVFNQPAISKPVTERLF